MGKINLHNYEAFLLDYFESNLSSSEKQELREFVLLHPELEIDLNDTELPELNKETISPLLKHTLKKKNEYSLEQEAFDYVENNLDEAATRVFEALIDSDNQSKEQVLLYQKTKLQADKNNVFANKSSLIKNEEALLLNNRLLNYIENQLSDTERMALEADLIGSPELLREFKLVALTKLKSEQEIVFPNKSLLRKEPKLVPLFSYRALSIAAASLLFVFAVFLVSRFYTVAPLDSGAARLSNVIVKPELKQVLEEPNKNSQPSPEKTFNEQVATKSIRLNTANQAPVFVAHTQETPPSTFTQDSLPLLANNQLQTETLTNPDSLKKEGLALNDVSTNNSEYYVPFEEETELQDESEQKTKSKGLWKFVAQLAQKANAIGVKSLQAQKIDEEHYLLSFNSFSIEKK